MNGVLAKKEGMLALQSLVTEELNGAQEKDLSACLQRTNQEPKSLRGPLTPW